MRRTQRYAGLLLAVLMALAVLAVPSLPATAHHEPPAQSHDAAGSGSLEGRELDEQQTGFPCFRVDRHLFGLRGAGTYEGRTATGSVVVFRGQIGAGETLFANGPLQVQMENTEVYYNSPFGTHGTEAGGGAGCSPTTVGDRVPMQFRVFAAEGTQDVDGDKDVDVLTGAAWVYRLDGTGTKVPCQATGSYARGTKTNPKFGDSAEVAEWTLSEDCVVVGNQAGTPGTGTAPRGTFHSVHGVHEPCFGDVMAGDCPRNIRYSYGQFLPKPGPFLTVSGPASAVIGCDKPVTVTARLTVTGLPQRDVPVTFSVDGPTPVAPPTGAGITGADGRAGFTFSAPTQGDYVVTARASFDGQERVASHTVRFSELPPLSVTLTGRDPGQTEEATTVTATVRNACGVLTGAPVDFSVSYPAQSTPWTGQATPASEGAITDELGQASFSFNGDRGGSYEILASTSVGTQRASATRTARLAINTLKRIGSVPLTGTGETTPRLSAMDPAGRYAYFATGERSADRVIKFDLSTFQRVGEALPTPGGPIESLVIDPAGNYAYATGAGLLKLDLKTFQWVDSIATDAQDFPISLVIDPAGRYAYLGVNGNSFGSNQYPAQVLKIDLTTLRQVGAIDLELGVEDHFEKAALMDPSGAFAYFTFPGNLGGRVVKIDLGTFQRAGTAVLSGSSEGFPNSGVIDPAGNFAYIGTDFMSPGRVVKVDLRTMARVGAITLTVDTVMFGPYPVNKNEDELTTALMDPAGRFAYFGTEGSVSSGHPAAPDVPARLIRIDLSTFTRAASVDLPVTTENVLLTGVIDPTGNFAYLGAAQADAPQELFQDPESRPGLVAKVALTRPPTPGLVADGDSYTTDYETPLTVPAPGVLERDSDTDGDPLVAGQASDPPGGSVVLGGDGSFTYTPDARFAGTDSFTYTASDGMGFSAPATVTVTVAAPKGLTGSAYGYLSDVSLFGGPTVRRGFGQVTCTAPDTPSGCAPQTAQSPSVVLPPSGGTVSDTDADGATAQYGPATIFSSGRQHVTTTGTTGPGGSVNTSTDITNVNTSGDEVLTAAGLTSSCTASPTGVSGGTSITGGTLRTSEGDPNVDGDDTVVTLPVNPAPNTVYNGQIEAVGDFFQYIFNEQIRNPDGSITVYAAHQRLLGPTAIGDLYIGKSVCGVSGDPGAQQPPVATDDVYSTDEDTLLSVPAPGVLGNDSDPDGDVLAAAVDTGPANGTVTLGFDGSFVYTPNPNFTGTDSFTYTVGDPAGGSDTGLVTLTVNPVNDSPAAVDDVYSTAKRTALTVAAPGVLGNDSDVDGGVLTATIAGGPSGGKVSVNGDGSFTYTPNRNFTGTDSFSYTVSDGRGGTDLGTVTITVGAAAPPPPPSGGADLSVGLTDSPDPARVGDQVSYTITVGNAGPDTATGVSVLLNPQGATYLSAAGATCTVVKGKQAGVRCALPDLVSGGSRSFTVTVQAPNKPGTITTTATVSASTNDPDTTDNTATQTTTVNR